MLLVDGVAGHGELLALVPGLGKAQPSLDGGGAPVATACGRTRGFDDDGSHGLPNGSAPPAALILVCYRTPGSLR